MKVEIWSDVVCPWCYIGKRRFEEAVAGLERPEEVEVVWRAFQLDPHASSAPSDVPYVERLARKYGVSVEQAEAMQQRITGVADGEGLAFRLDIAQPGNTLDAHRLIHEALVSGGPGLQGAVKERLLAAYQCEGKAIADPAVLAAEAVAAGMAPADVEAVLSSEVHAAAVRADQAAAQELDVTGVPFFLVDGRFGISGAQDAELLRRVLTKALAEARPAVEMVVGDADACGPDGCDVPPGV